MKISLAKLLYPGKGKRKQIASDWNQYRDGGGVGGEGRGETLTIDINNDDKFYQRDNGKGEQQCVPIQEGHNINAALQRSEECLAIFLGRKK